MTAWGRASTGLLPFRWKRDRPHFTGNPAYSSLRRRR